GGEIAAEVAADVDHAQARARRVGEDGRRARSARLLEHELVGAQAERVAWQLQRNVIVATELELGGGVEVAPRQFGVEPDFAGGEDIGGDRDDGGWRHHAAVRRADLHDASAPFDAGYRICELDRKPRRQLGQQRAKALAAEGIGVALRRAGEVDGRNLGQILAAAEWAKKELDARAPFTEVLRKRLRAGHVALAGRLENRRIGAHQHSQIVLHLAFAREAPPDAHA